MNTSNLSSNVGAIGGGNSCRKVDLGDYKKTQNGMICFGTKVGTVWEFVQLARKDVSHPFAKTVVIDARNYDKGRRFSETGNIGSLGRRELRLVEGGSYVYTPSYVWRKNDEGKLQLFGGLFLGTNEKEVAFSIMKVVTMIELGVSKGD